MSITKAEIIHDIMMLTPEQLQCFEITLYAALALDGQSHPSLPACSRGRYKRCIKMLRCIQHENQSPDVQQMAAKSIDLIREVCPFK